MIINKTMKFSLKVYATIEVRRVSSVGKYTTFSAFCICNAQILQILKEHEFEENTFTGIKNTLGSYNMLRNNKLRGTIS